MIHQRFRANPHQALRRALAALFEGAVESLGEEPWASATLEGRRHRLLVSQAGAPGRADELPDVEFSIPGHIVAEIAVVERHRRATGEALVVEALTVVDA